MTPPLADVAVVKTVDDPRPAVGEPTTWTITVTNHGPDTAEDVVVTDVLPAGLSLDSATPTQGSFEAGTGTWTVGPMADGASETLVLVTTVTGTVTAPTRPRPPRPPMTRTPTTTPTMRS